LIPKLVFNKHTKAKEYTKEEILREKIDGLLNLNEKMKKELEELKNMI